MPLRRRIDFEFADGRDMSPNWTDTGTLSVSTLYAYSGNSSLLHDCRPYAMTYTEATFDYFIDAPMPIVFVRVRMYVESFGSAADGNNDIAFTIGSAAGGRISVGAQVIGGVMYMRTGYVFYGSSSNYDYATDMAIPLAFNTWHEWEFGGISAPRDAADNAGYWFVNLNGVRARTMDNISPFFQPFDHVRASLRVESATNYVMPYWDAYERHDRMPPSLDQKRFEYTGILSPSNVVSVAQRR